MSTLEEHLESAYDVDVESQIALREADITREPAPAVDRFIIDDEDKANWALRKLARTVARHTDILEQARRERERIAAWEEEQTQKIVREQTFFESLLEQFHRNQLTVDPTKKTIKLPAGTLKARKAPDQLLIADEAEFVKWALENDPELVRTKHVPDRAMLRRTAYEYGEIVPGVTIEEGGIRYSVEVDS